MRINGQNHIQQIVYHFIYMWNPIASNPHLGFSLHLLQDHPAPPNWPASGYITHRAGKITSRKFVASVTSESTYPVFRTNRPAVSETIPLCCAVGESICLRSPSSFPNHTELTGGSARWWGQVTAESANALNVPLDLWVRRDWRF